MIRILIVADRPVFRRGLALLAGTTKEITVVGEAADRKEAIYWALQLLPDLILIDVGENQELEAQKATTYLRKSLPNTGVLWLTAGEEAAFGTRALDAGASGYIFKKRPYQELVTAIKRVVQTGMYAPTAEDYKITRLTAQERSILKLTAQGMSTKTIAAELGLSLSTIQGHKYSARTKLGLESVKVLARFAKEHFVD